MTFGSVDRVRGVRWHAIALARAVPGRWRRRTFAQIDAQIDAPRERRAPRLSIRPMPADSLRDMAAQDRHVLAASPNLDEATGTPTVIDADELAEARLDERWREFCLNAEQYVAETTRPAPRVQQPA